MRYSIKFLLESVHLLTTQFKYVNEIFVLICYYYIIILSIFKPCQFLFCTEYLLLGWTFPLTRTSSVVFEPCCMPSYPAGGASGSLENWVCRLTAKHQSSTALTSDVRPALSLNTCSSFGFHYHHHNHHHHHVSLPFLSFISVSYF